MTNKKMDKRDKYPRWKNALYISLFILLGSIFVGFVLWLGLVSARGPQSSATFLIICSVVGAVAVSIGVGGILLMADKEKWTTAKNDQKLSKNNSG